MRRPGSRRFRDLLARERADVAMLVGHVAEMYDSITFGRVSKPNTKPFEVIALYEEHLQKECDEAVKEAVEWIDASASKDQCNPPCLTFTAADWEAVKRDLLHPAASPSMTGGVQSEKEPK